MQRSSSITHHFKELLDVKESKTNLHTDDLENNTIMYTADKIIYQVSLPPVSKSCPRFHQNQDNSFTGMHVNVLFSSGGGK